MADSDSRDGGEFCRNEGTSGLCDQDESLDLECKSREGMNLLLGHSKGP